jgi:diguanylate cyclase (GGDEF)-like protein
VNDSLGHAVGDELLRAVAGRLRTAVRREDLAARLGGDEFAVLLRDSLEDPQHTAQGAVQRIQETMRAPFRVQGQRRQVRISIGSAIADASTPVDSPEELLHRADHAMYAAKDHNRRQNNRTRHRPVRSTAGDAP